MIIVYCLLINVSGVDYCNLGHRCSQNATCMNLNTKYTCKCNQGFDGDGITCNGKVFCYYLIIHIKKLTLCLNFYAYKLNFYVSK